MTNMHYIASGGFVTREIAGEVLAVPVGEMTRKLNGMITFSESGAFLWKLLSEKRTHAQLVQALAEEYGQKPEDVSADVDAFLEHALKRGMVEAIE